MIKVHQLARLAGGKLEGDGEREIRGVASLENATPDDLAFASARNWMEQAASSRAGCILIPEGASLPGHTVIVVAQPKLSLIKLAQAIVPLPPITPGIHSSAVISPQVRLAPGVRVGPSAVIERGASIGAGTDIGAGAFIGEGASVGTECVLYPRVTIYPGARLGNRVVLHAGVVIGSDGFGYVLAEGRHHKFPQLGAVIIEDDVEIGANSTVDRGSLGVTVVGSGTKVDNLVQIAHNVRIGHHCVIAAQTGISGSTEIGDYVVIGGQAGIGERVRIESRVLVGGQAGILPGKVIRQGSIVWGTPARPFSEFRKLYAHLSALPELARQVKELSKKEPNVKSQKSEL
ncbi:MAG: UDP-3-O-(3-hydroxymyristoyl)glucosamine N-acyltransferase [Terriglobia bacterium]